MSVVALLTVETFFNIEFVIFYAVVGLVPAFVCWRLSKTLDKSNKVGSA